MQLYEGIERLKCLWFHPCTIISFHYANSLYTEMQNNHDPNIIAHFHPISAQTYFEQIFSNIAKLDLHQTTLSIELSSNISGLTF